jgi:site-specific DNA-methyltransferase (adenine-specific)
MELDLITDDVLRALPRLPAESVDVCMTSPDYNLGVKYRASQKVKQLQDYLAWAASWGREVMRVLKPGGSFFLNISGSPAPAGRCCRSRCSWPSANSRCSKTRSTGSKRSPSTRKVSTTLDLKPIDPRLSVGHFKPLSTDRYVNDQHEYVFHFSHAGKARLHRKNIGVPYMDKSNIKRWGHTDGADVRCRGNTWFVPYKTIQSRNKQRPHPATFPPELAELAFRIAGVGPESTVMDIFVGLGNSGIGASRIPAGKFIGIDVEPYYIEESTARIIV